MFQLLNVFLDERAGCGTRGVRFSNLLFYNDNKASQVSILYISQWHGRSLSSQRFTPTSLPLQLHWTVFPGWDKTEISLRKGFNTSFPALLSSSASLNLRSKTSWMAAGRRQPHLPLSQTNAFSIIFSCYPPCDDTACCHLCSHHAYGNIYYPGPRNQEI